MAPTETTPLYMNEASPTMDFAKSSQEMLTTLLLSIQGFLLVFFLFFTTYSPEDYSPSEYVIFRDIMVMLLLGFGFIMTFLKQYGLGAVGFTMMLTAIAVQLNVAVELLMRFLYGGDEEDTILPLPLKVPTFIDGEFAGGPLAVGGVCLQQSDCCVGLLGCRGCWGEYDDSHVWSLLWTSCQQGSGTAQEKFGVEG